MGWLLHRRMEPIHPALFADTYALLEAEARETKYPVSSFFLDSRCPVGIRKSGLVKRYT